MERWIDGWKEEDETAGETTSSSLTGNNSEDWEAAEKEYSCKTVLPGNNIGLMLEKPRF